MKRSYVALWATLFLSMGKSYGSSAEISNDIDFQGRLVATPCIISSGKNGENIEVDFGTIPEKNFYSIYGNRSAVKPFHILLTECDTTLGKEVQITFRGTPDAEQQGLLAINSSTGVNHVGIGLQTQNGTNLSLNSKTAAYAISSGNTELNFKAYVQASKEGVKNRSVGRGTFEAISTFEVEYP